MLTFKQWRTKQGAQQSNKEESKSVQPSAKIKAKTATKRVATEGKPPKVTLKMLREKIADLDAPTVVSKCHVCGH